MGAGCHLWVFIFAHRWSSCRCHFCWWVFVSIGGQSFLFVGMPLHLWMVGFIHGCFFQSGGAPLLGWWMHVAIHGVVVLWVVLWWWGVMVTHLWWLVVICHCGSCDMAASHVKNEKWGVG